MKEIRYLTGCCHEDHDYSECAALQSMLRAADAAAEEQLKRLEAGDYTFDTFQIVINGCAVDFLLGGPQLAALEKFAEHIAAENFYLITYTEGSATVE